MSAEDERARGRAAGIGAVAVWSSTDLPGWGDQVIGRVVERALTSRLPGWRATHCAPWGWSRPSLADGGIAAEPLGTPTPTRLADLTAGADASVLAPAFALGHDPYAGQAPGVRFFLDPRVGHATALSAVRTAPGADLSGLVGVSFAAARDRASQLALSALHLDPEVVPHPGIAVTTAVDPATLPERVTQLRTLGLLPAGDYVLASAPGLDQDAVVVPPEWVLEDRVAAVAGARLVLAADEHAAAVAAGVGAEWVLVDTADPADAEVVAEFGPRARIGARTPPPGAPVLLPDAHDRLAAHFDALAEAVETARSLRDGDLVRRTSVLAGENAAVRAAHWQLRQRLLTERRRFAEPYATALRELAETREALAERRATAEAQQGHIEHLERVNADLAARLAAAERELAAWQGTKLVRWSEPLRRAYGRARG
ncbi:hypothetical protein [Actinokineospora bangkokensis]|uniref:Polysaccharide pyruvyl transferase domain-containing protein n=1 Tax=Actinokineospora bangkokensis TaxID=1193682 RepID=A0A1Q9LU77_9PSEU|nr:hypothetical protein [Actinokineospora bangkokensis]OLR95561.1 hypothetical protein BJP25_00260 [Actinokineospora bangkokensis]